MVAMQNPMLQMVALMRSGQRPVSILNALDQDDGIVRQLRFRIDSASPDQLKGIARSLCVCRGTSLEDVARQLGITIPSER